MSRNSDSAVVDCLFSSLGRFGQQTAVITRDGISHSYAELADRSDHLVELMRSRTLLLMLCSNQYDAICCYVGALRHDIVPVLLPSTIHDYVVARIIEVFHPAYIWVDSQRNIDSYEKTIIKRTGSNVLYALSFADAPISMSPHVAVLLPTSGSTADSHMVRLSMRNLSSNAESILSFLPVNHGDRVMLTLPMSYSYGLSIINTHLVRGATILLPTHGLLEREFWDYFAKEKPTTLAGVPYTYSMLQKVGFFSRQADAQLSYITQAGGGLPLSLNRTVSSWCDENHIEFYVMYGQTEATARIAYLPPKFAIQKCGSIGKAIGNGKLWLEDKHGNTIDEAMKEGMLCYGGPNVGLGYADNYLDLMLDDQWRGVLHTGDIAYRDKEGFYYIVGRQKRFIKVFGIRVGLDALEHLLMLHGYQCVCIGEDDVLTVYTDTHDHKHDIMKLLVEIGKIPPAVVTVIEIDYLPRNDAGKLLYGRLEVKHR